MILLKWNEVRKTYPNKFIVFQSLNQHEKHNILTVTDVAVIEVFDNLEESFKYYSKLHQADKKKPLNIGDTKKEKLTYNVKRLGVLR
nr:MAG TPA: hypothetical protein [Caudoviricetes sp.]